MVDALGGVDVCVNEPIQAWGAGGLSLPAGNNHLDGFQAIEFARARHGLGLGDMSDLSRISRQQKLVGSIMKTALSKNLSDLPSLVSFVNAAASSITTNMDVNDMTGLLWSIKGINLSNILFITAPIEPYKYDSNRVQFSEDAEDVWSAIKKDNPISKLDFIANPAPLSSTGDAGEDMSAEIQASTAAMGDVCS
jgi:anionic cell wall polymer biosynthesis LytR-Cps2A-Psr (LCP) family protein